jgi:hypothetical protein
MISIYLESHVKIPVLKRTESTPFLSRFCPKNALLLIVYFKKIVLNFTPPRRSISLF